jgi:integration host factor subunit beta
MPHLDLSEVTPTTLWGQLHARDTLVTKKEIVRDICERANKEKLMKGNLTQLATKEIVQWTFEAIIATLVKEGRIELRNFGVFEVKQRKPRKARNPRTGDRVDVAAKNVVTFQPGKEMEEQVRKFAKAVEPKKKAKKEKLGELNDRNLVAAGAIAIPEPVGAGAASDVPGSAH